MLTGTGMDSPARAGRTASERPRIEAYPSVSSFPSRKTTAPLSGRMLVPVFFALFIQSMIQGTGSRNATAIPGKFFSTFRSPVTSGTPSRLAKTTNSQS